MHGCRGSYITVRGPALRSVLVTAPLFGGLNLLCQQLTSLALHQCSKLGDGGIRAMVTRLTTLTSLDVSGCAVVTDESLRHVRQGRMTASAAPWSIASRVYDTRSLFPSMHMIHPSISAP